MHRLICKSLPVLVQKYEQAGMRSSVDEKIEMILINSVCVCMNIKSNNAQTILRFLCETTWRSSRA